LLRCFDIARFLRAERDARSEQFIDPTGLGVIGLAERAYERQNNRHWLSLVANDATVIQTLALVSRSLYSGKKHAREGV
jgi:hypothetical protein